MKNLQPIKRLCSSVAILITFILLTFPFGKVLAQCTPLGDTSVYGNHVWIVYAFNNGGDAPPHPHSWSDSYAGYYVDSVVNFATYDEWPEDTSPSFAPGYLGCPVQHEFHSWSAKRRGFECGFYQINIPGHDDDAQLFVNGTRVWSHDGCCDSHTNVWAGFLNDNSTVVFRVTQGFGGSNGAIEFVPVTNLISVDGPTTICPGFSQELNGIPGGTYLWSTGETTQTISVTTAGNYLLNLTMGGCTLNDSIQINVAELDTPLLTFPFGINNCPPYNNYPQLLNYNSSLNYYWDSPSTYFGSYYSTIYAHGNFTLTAVDGLGCTASAHVSIGAPPGVESDFGNEVWKVNGYYSGGPNDYGTSWLPKDYMGYYTDTTLNFDSQNQWGKESNASAAPNYQGCSMNSEYMSWSAKRTGFPCGVYRIDVLNHDDEAQLFVDGIKVWENFGYTDSTYSNAWTGALNSSSAVEFRVTDGEGYSYGALHFTIVGGSTSFITVSGNEFVCTGQSYLLTSIAGASYLWSNGETTNSIHASQTGSYSVTVTDDTGCTLTSNPVSVTILSAAAPVAHITTSANNICDWNTVTLTSDSASGNSWSTSATTQSITTDSVGNYTLTVTNASGCRAESSVYIGKGFTPPSPSVENSGPFCEGQAANLKATGLAPGGQAASFNGTAQYVEVTQSIPSTNFTIEMWVKTTEANTGIFSRVRLESYYGFTSTRLFLMNGQLYFSLTYYNVPTGFVINDGTWHHIAVVVQAGVGQIVFVDGTSSGIIDAADYVNYDLPTFRIGESGYFGSLFNGQIDNVRIWDQARSQTDIRNNMMLETPVSSQYLIYHSTLNGNLKANVGSKGHSPYGISYVVPEFYTYTWTGTGAPASSTSENQTTSVLSSTETYQLTVSTGCSPSIPASTTVTVTNYLYYYSDADGDGYGSPTSDSIFSCSSPGAGYASNNSDCDDSNPNINPGTTDICLNGIDDNCNGQTDETCAVYYADSDGDTYGNPAITIMSASNTPPAGYVSNTLDCNDASSPIHPGAVDVCNSIDDNCNGVVDENALQATLTPTGSVNVCKGSSVTLTANAVNGIEYIWFKSGKLISGASGSSYTVSRNGSYSVRESNLICSSISAATSVATAVLPTATITYTGSLDLCGSGSVLLTANSGSGFSYQWKKGITPISGATDQNYTVTSKGTYKVEVTNSSGCSKTSAGAKVMKSCKSDLTDEESVTATLNIYPNPAHGQFVIEMNLGSEEDALADVQIFNSLGQQVYSDRAEVSGGHLHQEVNSQSNLSAGNYFVRVIVNEKVFTEKIIIQ